MRKAILQGTAAMALFSMLAAQSLGQQATQQTQQAQPRQSQNQAQPSQPGQQPRVVQPGQQPGAAQPGRFGAAQGQRQANRATNIMAHWLLVDNRGEIALAKMAQEKAQNEEVKEFAKMMIQDHTDFVENLQQLTGQGGQTLRGPDGQRDGQPGLSSRDAGVQRETNGQAQRATQAQDGQQGQNQDVQRQAAQAQQPAQERQQAQAQRLGARQGQQGDQAGRFDIIRIKHELGQQCLASTQKMLGEKQGAEFDKCYMGHQLVMHMQMLDTLKVFQKHADGELATLIQGGIATTQDHLMHAEKIMQQLDGGAAASTARRPSATEKE